MNDQEFLSLGLNDALCLDRNDFYIQGNSRSLQWSEISANIIPWYYNNRTDWKDNETIDEAIQESVFTMYTINSYFDNEDIKNPVKKYL